MAERDRLRWDGKYEREGLALAHPPGLPAVFAGYDELFPTRGHAIDLACGRGRAAVWLAARGLEVRGLDISPLAVRSAQELAAGHGVADRCRFDVVDLDDGLADGPPVELILCHLFRDPRLDQAIIERLAPGGMLAIAVLSEVDHGPGPFRAPPGELRVAFSVLTVIAEGEARGQAWLLAKA
jgi:SAM-dependent methyltransferase